MVLPCDDGGLFGDFRADAPALGIDVLFTITR
jgi:hypothetical protein